VVEGTVLGKLSVLGVWSLPEVSFYC